MQKSTLFGVCLMKFAKNIDIKIKLSAGQVKMSFHENSLQFISVSDKMECGKIVFRRKIDVNTANSKEMDMLSGRLAGKLIIFAMPLAFSSILQQLFNSADVAVVGRFAGDNALAAVGSCVALVGIFVNLLVGLSVGPNAALAMLIGQKDRGKISEMLHTVMTFGIFLGIGLMITGWLTARPILELSGTLPKAL